MLKQRIDIAGVPFRVSVCDAAEMELADAAGEYIGAERLIRIDQQQEPYTQALTLWHEVIHAALYVTGQEEHQSKRTNEALVTALEHALFPFVDLTKLMDGGNADGNS